VKTAVTPKAILDKVSQIADTRFDETIEQLMATLRQRHCKSRWRQGCDCEFCVFLKTEYTDAKLNLHRVRKKIEGYDLWDSEHWQQILKNNLERLAVVQDKKQRFIKQQTL
jgi:hypothetical protein